MNKATEDVALSIRVALEHVDRRDKARLRRSAAVVVGLIAVATAILTELTR